MKIIGKQDTMSIQRYNILDGQTFRNDGYFYMATEHRRISETGQVLQYGSVNLETGTVVYHGKGQHVEPVKMFCTVGEP